MHIGPDREGLGLIPPSCMNQNRLVMGIDKAEIPALPRAPSVPRHLSAHRSQLPLVLGRYLYHRKLDQSAQRNGDTSPRTLLRSQ